MPRTLSSLALQGIYSQETGTAYIVLLTLSHPTLPVPIRVTSDAVNTISRSNTFVPYPFLITLPTDDDLQPTRARLTIDNVDRAIITSLRNIGTTPLSLLIEIVTSNTPDTVEFSSGTLTLRNVDGDAVSLTGVLGFEEILAEGFPGDSVTPLTVPGVFVINA
ncbi:MAG: DUF1833 family protein [Candidatus Binataceae bacterium]